MKPIPTWNQTFEAELQRRMAEYDCTRPEAMDLFYDDTLSEWRRDVIDSLQAGWIPDQIWINAANACDAYWWKMRVCHDYPDVHDRLSRAGRSLYRTLAALNQGSPT